MIDNMLETKTVLLVASADNHYLEHGWSQHMMLYIKSNID